MFYEEKLIDGIWCWRGTPDGAWAVMNEARLAAKLDDLAAQHATIIASWKREELEWDAERDALTARVAELEAESQKHYSMAVAMFYSGRVDELTGRDCRAAADKITALMKQPAADHSRDPWEMQQIRGSPNAGPNLDSIDASADDGSQK